MPVEPNNSKLYVDLDSVDAVAEIVATARNLDPDRVTRSAALRRTAADIGDHLLFLSFTHPEWFQPFQDEAVSELDQVLAMDLATAAALLPGTSDDACDVVLRRLHDAPTSWTDLTLLAGIRSEYAMTHLAEHVHRQPEAAPWVNRLGVHIGSTGPAVARFTPERWSMHTGGKAATGGFIGLPLDQVSTDPSITWHYLSFRPSLVDGLPRWPHDLLHIVSPRTYWFTLLADVDNEGRYSNATIDDEGEPYDLGLADCEANPPPMSYLELRPFNADLVARNGHIWLTPGVAGTVGGPPIGIYPNPLCPSCDVLMFHAAATESRVREYGDGFRSVFYCPECATASVTGTNWN